MKAPFPVRFASKLTSCIVPCVYALYFVTHVWSEYPTQDGIDRLHYIWIDLHTQHVCGFVYCSFYVTFLVARNIIHSFLQ